MHFLNKRRIIGFFLGIILFLEIPSPAYAIFSPVLNQDVLQVKAHILQSRKVNGVGDFYQVYDRIAKAVQAGKEGRANEGLFYLFWSSLWKILWDTSIVDSFAYSLSLWTRYWPDSKTTITSCLRDDIWEIQALQEETLNELFKAALLSDFQNSSALWQDYLLLEKRLKGGVVSKDGKDQTIPGLKDTFRETAVWFPSGGRNFYTDCPYGAFTEAWQALANSFNQMISIFAGKTGYTGGFGLSIHTKAKLRAAQRAQQWLRANQLKFTLGGQQGASPRSLINGPGFQGLAGELKVEGEYLKKYADWITNVQWPEKKTLEQLNTYIERYQNAQDDRNQTLKELETAMYFNLSLNQVSENILIDMERTLADANIAIKDTADNRLREICKSFSFLANNQGKNKSGQKAPTCQ